MTIMSLDSKLSTIMTWLNADGSKPVVVMWDTVILAFDFMLLGLILQAVAV
jgi:hypothetical protein